MGVITGLVSILKGLTELIHLGKVLFDTYNQARRDGWLEDIRVITTQLKNAKTDEERKELVRKLASGGFAP